MNPVTNDKPDSLRRQIWQHTTQAAELARDMYVEANNADSGVILDHLRKANAAAQALDNIVRGHQQPKSDL